MTGQERTGRIELHIRHRGGHGQCRQGHPCGQVPERDPFVARRGQVSSRDVDRQGSAMNGSRRQASDQRAALGLIGDFQDPYQTRGAVRGQPAAVAVEMELGQPA